jgi:hypothetical protein
MASIALVMSILVPTVGNWWYALTAVSPAAYAYYMQRGTRTEQVRPHALLLPCGVRACVQRCGRGAS